MDDELTAPRSKDHVIQTIRQAAAEAGFDPEVVLRISGAESSFDPRARNRRSSARGLFQLTASRLKDLKMAGVDLRRLPVEEQVRLGIESLKLDQAAFERRMGRRPEGFELYALHHLGPTGGPKVLEASATTPLKDLLSSRAIRANPHFREATAGSILDLWKRKIGAPASSSAVREPRLTPQQIEQRVVPPAPQPEDYPPDWNEIMRGQVSAQAPKVPDEPVYMARGGEVGEQLTRMIEVARTDDDFRAINQLLAGEVRQRAGGSPPEGEVADEPTAEELEAAKRPSFRVSSSGKGRPRGGVSKALESGTAAREMLRGMTMLPQNLAGAPVDLATLAMRPFGYNVEKPVMGSDWLKEKSRQLGVAAAPSGTPAEQGFFAAGDVLSNLVNPAAPVRGAVAAGRKTGEAAKMLARDFQEYNRQLGPAGASYAVRPSGSLMAMGRLQGQRTAAEELLNLGKITVKGTFGDVYPRTVRDPQTNTMTFLSEVPGIAPITEAEAVKRYKEIERFWDSKARNYFERKFGTPDDPIAKGILSQQIKGYDLEEKFPKYMLDQTVIGKTKKNPETGQERFFPKYPRALEDFTKRYDQATGLQGLFVMPERGMGHKDYQYLFSPAAETRVANALETEAQRLQAQGVPDYMSNPVVKGIARSEKDRDEIITQSGTATSRRLLEDYEKLKSDQENLAKGLPFVLNPSTLDPRYVTAIEKGEPIYNISSLEEPLKTLFNVQDINKYLATLPAEELAKLRFEDVVKNTMQANEGKRSLEALDQKIRSGKQVPDSVFARGVSAPLVSFNQGPFAGYAWKRIEDRTSTVPEGAYIGHSVGGYEFGGPTYTKDKRDGFKTGDWQIFTLRDPRNKPVTTIEVEMKSRRGEIVPIVKQIKGDGRATGNTAPDRHEDAVLEFLINYLKPARIEELNSYLTPRLQIYKDRVNSAPVMRAPELDPGMLDEFQRRLLGL